MSDNSVSLNVPLIPQPTDVSCWAASLTMVVAYRDQASYTPQTIAAAANMDVDSGYGWDQIKAAVSAWNLTAEGPTCAMPSDWAGWLRSFGPIWIVEVGNPNHSVVVVGIDGDGTPEGTTVTLNNPWPPNKGVVETKPFADFESDFELAPSPTAQIVHK
jgi:ABC-type bacteriocin/lantibiotic exporter with double-glycine peptidase domain